MALFGQSGLYVHLLLDACQFPYGRVSLPWMLALIVCPCFLLFVTWLKRWLVSSLITAYNQVTWLLVYHI